MKMIIFLILFFLYFTPSFVYCADKPTINVSYPEYLFYQGDYYRAITEILREKYFGNNTIRVENGLLLTKAHYFLADYQLARKEAKLILSLPGVEKTTKKQVAKWFVFALLQQNEDKFAAATWNKWVSETENDFPLRERFERVNPEQARLYSTILPGAGFLLTDSYGKALVSFALNALFIAGTVHYWKEKDYGIAALLLFFEMGWYFGGREASEENAREYNNKLWIKARDQWIQEKIKPDEHYFSPIR